jgi:hypothetical protein
VNFQALVGSSFYFDFNAGSPNGLGVNFAALIMYIVFYRFTARKSNKQWLEQARSN